VQAIGKKKRTVARKLLDERLVTAADHPGDFL
jgi:hypothetical protein